MPRPLPLLPSSSIGSRLEACGPARLQDREARAAARRRPVDAIGIADTGTGEQAARFARALASALAARGERPLGTLLAFTTPPRPDPELARTFVEARTGASEPNTGGSRAAAREQKNTDAAGALSLRAIDAEADGDALPDLSPPDGAIALLIGPPALASFDPVLAILLGADRPLARWPAALRTYRARYQLALGWDRPGIAVALAALVRGPLVLPGR